MIASKLELEVATFSLVSLVALEVLAVFAIMFLVVALGLKLAVLNKGCKE